MCDGVGFTVAVMFRLLGPVEVRVGNLPFDPGGPRQRAVLAALLVNSGLVVTWDTLIDRVWGECPPRGARDTLRAYAARIRRILERATDDEAPPARLSHETGGYRLTVDTSQIDVHRFRELVAEARATGDEESRVVKLRKAMSLWRGEPLTGVRGEWARRTRAAWQRERLDALVAWAQAELLVGNPAAVLAPLTEAADQHPEIEPLTSALMRALVALGRPTDALVIGAAHRERLADEFGTDQGTDLRALYASILRGDDDPPSPKTDRQHHQVPTPAQLPSDIHAFTGRTGHLAELDACLDLAERERSTAVVISSVSGTAGVGKTALAVRWAHRAAHRFVDGQLYINLRGFDPWGRVVSSEEAICGFLDALGVPPDRIPPTLDAQVGLYRSLLAGRRVLVVLDNARDAEQVRPLLPATPSAMVVVTSRDSLTPLVATEGARPLAIDLLSEEEARGLLTQRLGEERVQAESAAVDQIVDSCARLPLALVIVAARALQTGFPLSALAAELSQSQDRLDVLDAGDATAQVRAVLSWSYTTLSDQAARLFRSLGLHPGPDISAPAAASLLGRPLAEVRRWLAELVRASLLSERVCGRYAFHDLLRVYATELAHSVDSEHDRNETLRRVLDHYLHTARAADTMACTVADPIPLSPPRDGVSIENLTDPKRAATWFAAEQSVLLASIGHVSTIGWDALAWQLAWSMLGYLTRLGDVHTWMAVGSAALAATERLDHPGAQAVCHDTLAFCAARRGRFDEAAARLRRASQLCHPTDTPATLAFIHFHQAFLAERRGCLNDSIEHAQQALDLFRTANHRRGQAIALNNLAWCHANTGGYQRALEFGNQAIALYQELEQIGGEAAAWDTLGVAHEGLGQNSTALTCYGRARDLARKDGTRSSEADVLVHIGDIHQRAGRNSAAAEAWREALTIFQELGYAEADQVQDRILSLGPAPRRAPETAADSGP